MPEVAPERDLAPHRQCEIRRPSPPAILEIDGRAIHKPAGYYFDVVWIPNEIARTGARFLDEDNHEWVVAETFGSRLMPRRRKRLKAIA